MQAAVAALGMALPPVDKLNLPRMQVQAMGEKAPPPVASNRVVERAALAPRMTLPVAVKVLPVGMSSWLVSEALNCSSQTHPAQSCRITSSAAATSQST